MNEDDGDLNFEKNKAFANVIKATTDVELKYRNFGFFGRGLGYYDFDLHDSDKLGPTGRDRLGQQVRRPRRLRVRRLRAHGQEPARARRPPGDQLGREHLHRQRHQRDQPGGPLEASHPGLGAEGSVHPDHRASGRAWSSPRRRAVEGFYLTNFDKTRIDPRGSYFSNNDAISDDADRVIVSFGRRSDQHTPPGNPVPPGIPGLSATAAALYGPFDPAASIWVPRSADHNPSDNGQYGVAFRYLAHEFNNTEFGLYYMNYHSRVPFFAGVKGTTTSVLTGGPLIAPICGVAALRALCATGTARYFVEYPENIRLFGLSFNTAGPRASRCRASIRIAPTSRCSIATAELILAALGLPNVITGFTQIPGAPAGATSAALVPDGTYIQGYRRVKASQAQVSATKSCRTCSAPTSSCWSARSGFNWFHNLPTDVKFTGPATYLPATAFGAALFEPDSVQTEGFLTEYSWGYRLAGRLEYASLL